MVSCITKLICFIGSVVSIVSFITDRPRFLAKWSVALFFSFCCIWIIWEYNRILTEIRSEKNKNTKGKMWTKVIAWRLLRTARNDTSALSERVSSVKGLSKLQAGKTTISQVTDLLRNNKHHEIREAAAKALAEIGSHDAIESLRCVLLTANDPSVVKETADALSSCNDPNSYLEVLSSLVISLHAIQFGLVTPSDRKKVQLSMLQAVRSICEDKEIRNETSVERLRNLLTRNRELWTMDLALDIIQKIDGDEARKVFDDLSTAIDTNGKDVFRRLAICALSERNVARDTKDMIVAQLSEILRSHYESPDIRKYAAQALGKIGSPEAAYPLRLSLFMDSESRVIKEAAKALASLTNVPLSRLWVASICIYKENHEVLCGVLETIKRTNTDIDSVKMIEPLKDLLMTNEDVNVLRPSVDIIEKIGGNRARKALDAVLKDRFSPNANDSDVQDKRFGSIKHRIISALKHLGGIK